MTWLVGEDCLFGDDYQSVGPDASTTGTSSGYVQCFARDGAPMPPWKLKTHENPIILNGDN